MRILLCIHESMFIGDISLTFSFFVESSCVLGIRATVTSWNEFGSVPSVFILWNSLRNIGINSS